MSWTDDRLPEMLWAALLVAHLPREEALSVFREVANHIFSLPASDRFKEITHSGLSQLPQDRLAAVLDVITSQKAHREVLGALLLLEDIPAAGAWKAALASPSTPPDWEALAHAVARTLFHQSQESTDCRWARVIALMAAGKLKLPPGDTAKELGLYPNYGDMRKVRPTIRAMEGSLSCLPDGTPSKWPARFWAQCLRDTPCFPLHAETLQANASAGTTREHLRKVIREMVSHCTKTTTTTALDARHDALFGCALYSLAVVEELLRIGNAKSVIARGALRTIVECYITLAYLHTKSDPELWKSYRAFGAGQAKLAFLKLDQASEQPASVDLDTLRMLANEDMWEELVPINLGHWEKTDLRRMSEEAGVKDAYDKFYSWTSTYSHGHWCAVRDSVFDTCGNPLHRLHRIPREAARTLPDVLPDACELIDKILGLVSQAYPGFQPRVTISG